MNRRCVGLRARPGQSLIATGQSGADNFMAEAIDAFRTLSREVCDPHFEKFASFLEVRSISLCFVPLRSSESEMGVP